MNQRRALLVPLLLSVLLVVIGLGISTLASWLAESPSAAIASHAPAVHTIGSAWLHVGAAVVFVGIAFQITVPWFNLLDIIHGEGEFSGYSPAERASFARSWVILVAALILGIAWAGV